MEEGGRCAEVEKSKEALRDRNRLGRVASGLFFANLISFGYNRLISAADGAGPGGKPCMLEPAAYNSSHVICLSNSDPFQWPRIAIGKLEMVRKAK